MVGEPKEKRIWPMFRTCFSEICGMQAKDLASINTLQRYAGNELSA